MRASLASAVAAGQNLRSRWALAPMARAVLWDRDPPRTSQRRALLTLMEPGVLMTLIRGGNRTGKSELMAMWCIAKAAGRDAWMETQEEPLFWVRRWLSQNGLPLSMIQPAPGRIWVGSPTFASAVEQIRPKLLRWAPGGTHTKRWSDKQNEAEMFLPNGGVIVSKAYKQFDMDNQTWEGASLDGLGLDEQPNQETNLTAGVSRLVDRAGQTVMALTPLRGKNNWLYQLEESCPPWLRVARLYGADNPYIPQAHRDLMLSAVPKWQRASRDTGEYTNPEGRVYLTFDRSVHVFTPFEIPRSWTRWVGIDWGGRTAHIVWAAEDGQGRLWVYRELAIRRTTLEPAVRAAQLVEWAIELEKAAGDGDLLHYRVADSEDPGAIQEAAYQGWLCIPVNKYPGSVVAGIELVDALVSTVDALSLQPQEPRLFISRDCPVLISEMEGLLWAEGGAATDPKPAPGCPDHGPDALRYICMHRKTMGLV